jgi:hypothetical protein
MITMKKLKTIYFWWDSSYVYPVKFVSWCRMRMCTGREDSKKIGVGAIVESDWLFSKTIVKKIPYGLKRGQYRIRPYIPLYRTHNDAWQHKRKIRRPKVEEIKS